MERDRKSGGTPEEKPFLEHLEDLRRLFWKILICWGAASLGAYALAGRVFDAAQWPLLKMARESGGSAAGFVLRSLSPPEAFLISIKLSLMAGLIIALPLVLYLIARFLLPALKPSEKRYLVPSFLAGGGLFFAGVLFAYGVVLPLGLRFFWQYTERMGIRPEWTAQNYIGLAGKLALGFGLVFELPVVILLLAALGIIDHDTLKRKRPYVIVGILILAAVLTPPDVITQILMAIPLLILFEICLFLTRFVNKSG